MPKPADTRAPGSTHQVRVFVDGKLTGTIALSPGHCCAPANPKAKFTRTGDPGTQITTAFSPLAARVAVESACPTRGGDASLRYRTEYTLYAGRPSCTSARGCSGTSPPSAQAYRAPPLAGEDPRVFLNRTGESVEVRKPTSAGATDAASWAAACRARTPA